ncbi:fibronectin type III domain-containing protein [Flavobacterium sp.]
MFKNNKYFIFFVYLFSFISYGQVNTYGFLESNGSYAALPLLGSSVAYSVLPTGWDNNVNGAAHLANIGFNFVYDGAVQTDCYINPNGFITFGVQMPSTQYVPLSTPTVFTNGGAISALAIDLKGSTDDIIYATIGSAPNRTFVVQWTNAERKALPGLFNFQIRLSETSNKIELVYGNCLPTGAALGVQVGIRGAENVFLQGNVKNRLQSGANINFPWAGKTIEGASSSHTVRTSATEYPNNGLKYTYTPSLSCTTPTANASSLVIGGTNVTATSFVGNSFVAASPAPTNYLVLRSLVNTPPVSSDIPNRTYFALGPILPPLNPLYTVVSITNLTTFVQTGLQPNTTYYYWVIPYNAGCLGGPFYRLSGMLSATKTTCAAMPVGLVASTVEGNSFTASWNPVVNAADYKIDVSTTATFSAIVPGYNDLSTAGATSIAITGLNSVTKYYFRVRAVGSACFFNSAVQNVTTLCGSFPIPYFQSFDTTPVNTTPQCFTIADMNADGILWQVKNTQSASAPNSIHLNTNTTTDSDDSFFTPGLQLNAGVTYRLKFKYTTESAGLYSENLRVRLGTGPSEPEMSLTLINLPNTVNTVYQTAIVDFNAVIAGNYYIGFQGYSFLGQSKIIIDDVSIIVSPTCFEPTSLSVTAVGTSSATLSWDESVPPPTNGYQYYVSTSSNLPNATATPTGSVGAGILSTTLSGLLPATLYYVWVRGNCDPTDQSIWSLSQNFSTGCATPANLPVIGGTLCGGGSATLQATPAPGAIVQWYSDSAGTNLLATGDTFTTPTLFATTTYYAQSKASGGLITLGPGSPTLQGGALGSENTPTFINFAVSTITDLQSIDIYPIMSGQNGTLTIKNSSSTLLGTYNFVTNVSGGGTAQVIPIGLALTAGSYALTFVTVPTSGLGINVDNGAYPYSSSLGIISGNNFDNTFYMYAYNWKFTNICRSLVTPVAVNITAPPAISLSQTTATLCYGESTPTITLSGYGAYDTLVWTPSSAITGDESTGYVFNPTVSTNYSLIASQTSGALCMASLNVNVTVKAQPPAIAIIPVNPTICQGQIQLLSAALASATPTVIYQENFNAMPTAWTISNASFGGNIVESSWTQRTSPYTYTGSSYWATNNVFTSNDNSKFFFTNSDAQGGPSSNRTITYLESPSINMVGYTSASISFWHYLRFSTGNKARVEATINGGTTWTPIASYTASTPTTSTNGFVNAIVDANSLVGNPAVKFRFYYDANWAYGWAVDNFVLSGTLAVQVTWSPITNLYFDAAASSPYTAGTPAATIYSKPTATRTYTGSAVGSNGCTTTGTDTVNVTASPTLGTLSSNQVVCANWGAADLQLNGYTNSIVNWQYALDAAFTSSVTTIANTTNVLTTAAIGDFYGDRFYRATLQNGTCPTVLTNSVSISRPYTAWNGSGWSNGLPSATKKVVFAGNYSNLANINACSVEVLSGNVLIKAGYNLIVENDVKVVGGSLTFENNSSLVQLNTLDNKNVQFTNSGNITYKRTTTPIKKFDYTYWSSPVFPQTLGGLSPNSTRFYYYDPIGLTWATATAATSMIPGKGYIVRAPDVVPFNTVTPNVYAGSFIGIPTTGNVSTPIVGTGTPFNLIGNPYASAISADAFLSFAANVPVIDATIYLWTHNTSFTGFTYTANDYAMYNYSGGTGTGYDSVNNGVNNSVPNGKIPSGQAFFIKGLTDGNAVFNNGMRLLGNNNQFFRMQTPTTNSTNELERHRFWLDIFNDNGGFKELLVAYIENATDGLDRGFDGEFMEVGNQISLYAFQDALKLSIQGRALPFADTDTIPVGFTSTTAGNYQIKLPMYDGLFTTQDVYLEDKELNIVHNLKQSSYQFTTEAGTFDTRFVIRFTPANLLGTETHTLNEVVVFKNQDNDFVVASGQIILASVQVYDVQGRLLQEYKNIDGNTLTVDGGETNQVLLLHINDVNGNKVTKKVIR